MDFKFNICHVFNIKFLYAENKINLKGESGNLKENYRNKLFIFLKFVLYNYKSKLIRWPRVTLPLM